MNTDLELELVRELAGEPADPSPAARERARAALLASIDAEGAGAPPPAVRRPRWRRRRLLVPSLGLAGAAGAATLVLVLLGNGGAAQPDPAAAAALERVARVAAAGGGPRTMHAGQFWYVRSRNAYTTVSVWRPGLFWTTVTPQLREIWVGRDGGGRVSSRASGRTTFASARDRAAWVRAGRPDLGGGLDAPLSTEDAPAGTQQVIAEFGSEALTYRGLLALPTDPDALERRVRAAAGKAGPSPREEMFTIVGDVLREAPAPPALRAALYRVAARIPGIELVGETHDGLGRPALAVALTARGSRRELLFDPRTARLLGEREVYLSPAPGSKLRYKPGFVIGESSYLDSGIVQRVGQRP